MKKWKMPRITELEINCTKCMPGHGGKLGKCKKLGQCKNYKFCVGHDNVWTCIECVCPECKLGCMGCS